ncbi:class III extradiol ring-cleavage dioxygenase family protein [Nocardiopsis coralliicola]
MLIAAAVCPHPPLLVPELARGAAPELDGLRAQCAAAVDALAAARPDVLVAVGAGGRVHLHGPDAGGSLAPFGADVQIGPGDAAGGAALPPALLIGRWLAERSGLGPHRYLELAGDTPTAVCGLLGAGLAALAPRVALLVLGDGSARRPPASPGRPDPRADVHDAAVAAALKDADASALLALEPADSAELMAAGRPAWQVLAGAGREAGLSGELLADTAPYGVGYFVASWS